MQRPWALTGVETQPAGRLCGAVTSTLPTTAPCPIPPVEESGRNGIAKARPQGLLLALVAKGVHHRPRDLEGLAALDVAVAQHSEPDEPGAKRASPMRHIS